MTADFITEAALRYECGEPSTSIATTMDCSVSTVFAALKSCGIKSRKSGRRTITDAVSAEIGRRYLAGESRQQIAESMRCGESSVDRALVARGVPPQARVQRRRARVAEGLEVRFRRYVPSGEPDACWPFEGCRDKKGYGQIGVEGKKVAAHRVAFFLANGYWPTVCRHTCDFPPCCNPKHLLDGTDADNSRDMVERGRQLRGERAPLSKLTESDVAEIKARLGTCKGKQLAREFGVRASTISKIKRGQRWGHC